MSDYDSKVMMEFWNKVNRLLGDKGIADKPISDGYIEICADGMTYRSLPTEQGTIWICWNPYSVLYHFTAFRDENATVRYVDASIDECIAPPSISKEPNAILHCTHCDLVGTWVWHSGTQVNLGIYICDECGYSPDVEEYEKIKESFLNTM